MTIEAAVNFNNDINELEQTPEAAVSTAAAILQLRLLLSIAIELSNLSDTVGAIESRTMND